MYAYSPTFLQNFTLGRILSRFYDFFELTGRLHGLTTFSATKFFYYSLPFKVITHHPHDSTSALYGRTTFQKPTTTLPTGLRLMHIGKTDPQYGTVQFCFRSGRLTCSARTGFRAITTPLALCGCIQQSGSNPVVQSTLRASCHTVVTGLSLV